jgi:CTD kinase subunit beta
VFSISQFYRACFTLTFSRPIRTFDTACTFYHIFRLTPAKSDYGWRDAAIACLFFACKAEDTLKKSKEILCAAHNLQHPGETRTPDDKVCSPSGCISIGLRGVLG